MKRSRLDNPDCAFLVSALIALFLVQVESALWPPPPSPPDSLWRSPFEGWWLFPFNDPGAGGSYGFLWVVLIVAAGNSWLLHQGLRRFGGEDAGFRKWVLGMRRILLAPPFLGLCVLPAWKALLNVRPAWACRPGTPHLVLDTRPAAAPAAPMGPVRLAVRAALHGVVSSKLFLAFWVVAVNLLALRCGLAWLNVPERQSVTLAVAAAGCAALRCLGLACMVYYMVRRMPLLSLTWRRKLFLWVLLIFWVVPSPAIFVISLAIYIQLEGKRVTTAIHAAFAAGASAQPLTQASRTEEAALPSPVRWLTGTLATTTAEGGLALRRQLGFYRAKVFLLLLDTGALTMTLMWLGNGFSWLDLPAAVVLTLICGTELILLAAGLLSRARSLVQRLFRPESWQREQELYPVMRYVLLSSLAFFAGFLTGTAAGQRDATRLGLALLWHGSLAFVFGTLFILPGLFRTLSGRGEDRSLAPLLWLVVFQMMGQLGGEMAQDPQLAGAVTNFLHGAVLLTPLWALLLWSFRISWVIRPYRLRDLRRPGLPAGVRWRLVLITVTAALPLGGLFVPLWIRMRRRFEAQAGAGEEPLDGITALSASPVPTVAATISG